MSDGKKTVVDWGKISYFHKLALLREAGINLRRLTQEDVNNFGMYMLEYAENKKRGIRLTRKRVSTTRTGARSRTRKRMPPRRRSQ